MHSSYVPTRMQDLLAAAVAALVLLVSFITCVAVMFGWRVRSEWRWRGRFFPAEPTTYLFFLFGSCHASFLEDAQAQPCWAWVGPRWGLWDCCTVCRVVVCAV